MEGGDELVGWLQITCGMQFDGLKWGWGTTLSVNGEGRARGLVCVEEGIYSPSRCGWELSSQPHRQRGTSRAAGLPWRVAVKSNWT